MKNPLPEFEEFKDGDKRRDRALANALAMPPKPHKPIEKPKRKPRNKPVEKGITSRRGDESH